MKPVVTKFFWSEEGSCSACGKGGHRLPVGAKFPGQPFKLTRIPDHGIENRWDWIVRFEQPGSLIETGEGRHVSAAEMIAIIDWRSGLPAVPCDRVRRANLAKKRVDAARPKPSNSAASSPPATPPSDPPATSGSTVVAISGGNFPPCAQKPKDIDRGDSR